jgi:hypothetical protein
MIGWSHLQATSIFKGAPQQPDQCLHTRIVDNFIFANVRWFATNAGVSLPQDGSGSARSKVNDSSIAPLHLWQLNFRTTEGGS